MNTSLDTKEHSEPTARYKRAFRVHGKKLVRSCIEKYFFSVRVMGEWKKLNYEIKIADSL